MPQIEISEQAFQYLKKQAEPLVDTAATVLDRIIAEHSKSAETNDKPKTAILEFKAIDAPSVKHSYILDASIDGRSPTKKDWNHILASLIDICIQKGFDISKIKDVINMKYIEGNVSEESEKKGYRYKLNSLNFTFQGLDAERSLKNILAISEKFNISIELEICWNTAADPHYVNKKAKLLLP